MAISAPTISLAFLPTVMSTVFDFGATTFEKSGLPQLPAFSDGWMRSPRWSPCTCAQQHGVDLAQARVFGAAHGAAGVVEDARAVRVLEHQGAVERAELAGMAAQRRDLDGLGLGGRRGQQRTAGGQGQGEGKTGVHGGSP